MIIIIVNDNLIDIKDGVKAFSIFLTKYTSMVIDLEGSSRRPLFCRVVYFLNETQLQYL